MMKAEFEGILGKEVTVEEYEVIEEVYNFHPAISETEGKEEIVALYRLGGMGLMREMQPAAWKMENLERQARELLTGLNTVRAEQEKIRQSYKK